VSLHAGGSIARRMDRQAGSDRPRSSLLSISDYAKCRISQAVEPLMRHEQCAETAMPPAPARRHRTPPGARRGIVMGGSARARAVGRFGAATPLMGNDANER